MMRTATPTPAANAKGLAVSVVSSTSPLISCSLASMSERVIRRSSGRAISATLLLAGRRYAGHRNEGNEPHDDERDEIRGPGPVVLQVGASLDLQQPQQSEGQEDEPDDEHDRPGQAETDELAQTFEWLDRLL